MKVTTTDQMGRTVEVPKFPKRIISLVPSQTELLLEWGLPVVGRTKFCIHPTDKVKDIAVIGGTKQFRMDKIHALKPDLIIGNKEENYPEGIAELAREYPVWMSDMVSITDVLEMISLLGELCNRQEQASELLADINNAWQQLKNSFSGRVLYLIWKEPWMAAGKQTYIHSVLEHLGFQNVVEDARYPELSWSQISALSLDVVLLSSEPYPFKQSHIEAFAQANLKAKCVDGEMFSWYGYRMRLAAEYFRSLHI